MIRLHPPILTGLLVFAVLFLGNIGIHKVLAATEFCIVKQTSNSWSIDPENGTATGTFIVTGGLGCSQDVSVMSWNADTSKLPGDEFWTTQTVNDVQTRTVGAGTHSITVKLPSCSGYQADIIADGSPSSVLKPPGQGSYYDGQQPDGSGIVVASAVGDNRCPEPSSSPPPPTTVISNDDKPDPPTTTTPPTIQPPTNTFTPITSVVTTTPSGAPIILASASKPTTLPNTGPGQTIGLFLLVSVVSGLVHHGYHRRRNRMVFDAATIIEPSTYHLPHLDNHHQPHHHAEHPQPEQHQPPHQQ